MKDMLSPADLAEFVGVPVRTVYAWRHAGEDPPGYRVGKHVRYRREDVEAWLAARADDRPAA
jgi:excisionase family DNA binding protein